MNYRALHDIWSETINESVNKIFSLVDIRWTLWTMKSAASERIISLKIQRIEVEGKSDSDSHDESICKWQINWNDDTFCFLQFNNELTTMFWSRTERLVFRLSKDKTSSKFNDDKKKLKEPSFFFSS